MGGMEPVLMKPRHEMKCRFAEARQPDLPITWEAAVFEQYKWPPPEVDPDEPSQPFRLYMRIQRGPYRFRLPIHDQRERWLVPKFKVRLGVLRFPMPPAFHIGTYFVYQDGLRTTSICQWLTIILAQRGFLTEAEEGEAIKAFFVPGDQRGLSARLTAYERLKRTFVQPTGGWISLPALYQKTCRHLIWADLTQSEGNPEATDAEGEVTLGPLNLRAARPHLTNVHRDTPLDHPPLFISLRQLRCEEPALHRALLDRIRRGLLKTYVVRGGTSVSTLDADRVDEERRRNAERKVPLRFPGRRTAWARRLSARGIKFKSAQRQIKRWINHLSLSEAEIEASVAKGRAVRLPPQKL